MTESATQNASTQQQTIEIGNFGTGLLPILARELFGELKRVLGLVPEKADRVCRIFMADYGRVLQADAAVKLKLSKSNKEGMVNLGYAIRSTGKAETNSTHCLQLTRTVIGLADAAQDSKVKGVIKMNLHFPLDWETILSKELVAWITAI